MMTQTDETPEPIEPEIVIVRLGTDLHYVVQGDSYLSEMMLVGGTFPKPVGCLHFDDIFQAKMAIGQDFNPQAYWQIHPEIVARLRAEEILLETDA